MGRRAEDGVHLMIHSPVIRRALGGCFALVLAAPHVFVLLLGALHLQ